VQSEPPKSDGVITREEHRKYQFMEVNLQRRMTGLNDKIPDIKKTLETVQFLKSRRVGWRLPPPSNRISNVRPLTTQQDESDPMETTFELNETLYARANIPPTDEVHIWLGVCASPLPCPEEA
jgi:prefoldin subunit 5